MSLDDPDQPELNDQTNLTYIVFVILVESSAIA